MDSPEYRGELWVDVCNAVEADWSLVRRRKYVIERDRACCSVECVHVLVSDIVLFVLYQEDGLLLHVQE